MSLIFSPGTLCIYIRYIHILVVHCTSHAIFTGFPQHIGQSRTAVLSSVVNSNASGLCPNISNSEQESRQEKILRYKVQESRGIGIIFARFSFDPKKQGVCVGKKLTLARRMCCLASASEGMEDCMGIHQHPSWSVLVYSIHYKVP